MLPGLHPGCVKITWLRVYVLQLVALFRLAFAAAPPLVGLNLAATRNSPDHSTKGTQSPWAASPRPKARSTVHRASTGCKRIVSGTISLPSRGAFHLSLTVLFTIGHQGVFSLGSWTTRLPTGLACPAVLGRGFQEGSALFAYWAITVYGGPFQALPLRCCFVTSPPLRIAAQIHPATPAAQRTRA